MPEPRNVIRTRINAAVHAALDAVAPCLPEGDTRDQVEDALRLLAVRGDTSAAKYDTCVAAMHAAESELLIGKVRGDLGEQAEAMRLLREAMTEVKVPSPF